MPLPSEKPEFIKSPDVLITHPNNYIAYLITPVFFLFPAFSVTLFSFFVPALFRMSFPVPFPFPFLPVFFKMTVGDAFAYVPRRHMAVTRRKVKKRTWHSGRRNIYPPPIVASCSEPVPLIHAIPVSLVKEDVRFYPGNKIDICPRNEYQFRRPVRHKNRRDIYPYANVDIRAAFCRVRRT